MIGHERLSLLIMGPHSSVMIARWKNECIPRSDLPVAWVQFSAVVGVFQKGFSLADHILPTHPESV